MILEEQLNWLGLYLETLIHRNSVIELRQLMSSNRHAVLYLGSETPSGQRVNWQSAARSLYQKRLVNSFGVPFANIYHTIQPLHPGCIARAPYQWEPNGKCSSKTDITAIRQLCFDLDVQRPSGIPATDEEHQLALSTALNIAQELQTKHRIEPFTIIDTGNGAQLIYFVETNLTTHEEHHLLQAVEPILQTIESMLPQELVLDRNSIRTTQLARFPLTYNRKGYEFGTRRHRLAKLLLCPNPTANPIRIDPVPPSSPANKPTVNRSAPAYAAPAHAAPTMNTPTTNKLYGLLQQLGYEPYPPEERQPNLYRIRLRRCPFNPEHRDKAAVFYDTETQRLAFRCFKCQYEGTEPNRNAFIMYLLDQLAHQV